MADSSSLPTGAAIDTSWLMLIALYAHQVSQLEAALHEARALLQRQAELVSQSEQSLRKQSDAVEREMIASGRLVPVRELTASMAHELNNPLGIILGFAQERLSDIDPLDPSYRTLEIIHEEALRCERVVRDLLEFARPRSTECVQTDVKEVIAKTVDLLAERFEREKIQVQQDIDPQMPLIDADPQQLQEVLVKLCSNSLDAMAPGGMLCLAAKREASDRVDIRVRDTGFGIDGENLIRIFQPFFTAKKRRGLGLGLTICDRIVKSHGGSLEVESRPGEGTTFTIHLPVIRGAA